MSYKLIKVLETDFQHSDDRGSLVQIVHEGYRQVNVITSRAGAFRGGHYHKENDEAFYIVSGKVSFEASCDEVAESCEFGAGDFFGIGPGVMHGFTFLEDTLLVSFYSNGVEHSDGTKDIFSE